MMGNELFLIQVSPMEATYARAIDDEKFYISGANEVLQFTDTDLEKDKTGRYILDISSLHLGNVKEVEVPAEILEARKEKRAQNAIAKGAISIIPYQEKPMYFYLEGDQLRIRHGDKEIIADKIENVYGKKAVNVEDLELGHSYFELPVNVALKFEDVLKAKELAKLALIPAGKSLLNGLDYYRLNMEIPAGMWEKVKNSFENWGEPEGWTTNNPGKVASILNIPIL